MYKCVIFDMNGVFIKDSGPLSVRIEKQFGIPASTAWPLIKEALKKVRVPGSETKPVWQPVLDLLKISYQDFFDFWFSGESLNQELLDFAKSLKSNGTIITILSNNFPERTTNYRQLYPQLFAQIDEQYFSWETGKIKPDLAAFTQILDKHSFTPQEYVYFDDSEENLAAAASLGIVTHKYHDLEEAKNFLSQQNV